MASRESQGLQIAVIVFAMLTIILAITTYIFYAQSNSNFQAKVQADTQKASSDTQNRTLTYRSLALQHVLGDGGVTLEQVEAAKMDDETATRVLKNFEADMALLGDSIPPESKNYRTLPTYLLAAINTKNNSVVTSQYESVNYQKERDATKATEEARAQKAEEAAATANASLAAAQTAFQTDMANYNKEKETVATQLAEKDKDAKKQREEDVKIIDKLNAELTLLRTQVDGYRNKVNAMESETVNTFENPDGRITWVNQKQQLVWINVGRADGLGRQTNFAVFDRDTSGVANAEPKARIEVVRIIDEHLAEAQILEDSPRNPILPNDVIHTPSWSPGQRIRFALAGFIDINGDGQSDRDMIRNIITMNGGVIDAEVLDDGTPTGDVTVNTRYLVLGDKPTDKTGGNALKNYTTMLGKVQTYGVDTISVQKLLDQMGWRAEERTIELGGKGASPGSFRKRTPGSKGAPAAAPAAPAEAPAEEAAPAPATTPEADPFATP